MSLRRTHWAKVFVLAIGAVALSALPARAQLGPVLTAPGPVNRSMGGTAVAAPVDTLGALYWNPATITALPSSMDFGLELLIPHSILSSSVGPFSGATSGQNGVYTLPAIGLVFRTDDSPLTFGFGAYPVAGFGVNYPASLTNPILTAPAKPPAIGGLGAIYSQLQVLQLAPTVAMQVTDRLSIGGGPTLNLASLDADPLFITFPNGNGSYPPGTHGRVTWGGGFQAGVYYTMDGGWRVGASFKSQQWLENFHWQSVDQFNRPRLASFHADLPMIPSIGVAYSGIERWLFAADFRYVDFADTPGFHQRGFDATGAVQGLGFRSIVGASAGVQYRLTDTITLRAGYSYNDNPISDSQSSFNVASPTIIEHVVSVGASYRVCDALSLSLGYVHGFENSVAGPLVTPFGAVPGSVVRSRVVVDTFQFGATVRFGPRAATAPVPTEQ